uniref:Uncharacterized protein n=1 Tax=Magallana gigas TaxID=29159 RepID=A0A8W8JCM0_MAGGI
MENSACRHPRSCTEFSDRHKNSCKACTPGCIGPNCTIICLYPGYGVSCQSECKCVEEQCNPITGCGSVTVTTTDIYKQGFTNVSILKILYVPYANVTTNEEILYHKSTWTERCYCLDTDAYNPPTCCEGNTFGSNNENCTACLAGFQGPKCDTACRSPSYGKGCQSRCNCDAPQCHHITGCKITTEGLAVYGVSSSLKMQTFEIPKDSNVSDQPMEGTQCHAFLWTCMNQRNIAMLICFCVFGTLIFGIIGISVLVIAKQNIS